MMKSVDRLRELAADMNEDEIRDHSVISVEHGEYNRQMRLNMNHEWLNDWHAEFGRLCDALETEVAERYMELPVDRGGVPIHVGDRVRLLGTSTTFTVYAVGDTHLSATSESGLSAPRMRISEVCHYKPPAVEDVIGEIAARAANYTTNRLEYDMTDVEYEDAMEQLRAEFAPRLRVVEGGDE